MSKNNKGNSNINNVYQDKWKDVLREKYTDDLKTLNRQLHILSVERGELRTTKKNRVRFKYV